ncbi:MAG: PQQ-binding-like beta-propeller repeat protein [Planctomycetota bacterium]
MGEQTSDHLSKDGQVRSLRLWPAFAILLVQFAIMFVPQMWSQLALNQQAGQQDISVEAEFLDNPQTVLNSKLLGPALGTLLLLLWWLLLSGAPLYARFAFPVAVVAMLWLAWQFTDATMMFAFFMFVVPCTTASGVVAFQLFRKRPFLKRGLLAITFTAASLILWTQFRMQGVDGDLNSEFVWRWGKTDEHIFLSELRADSLSGKSTQEVIRSSDHDSPQFRGSLQDGIVRGVSIRKDWPQGGLPELWRRRIGPGWSSFAVVGDWLFTQEQRGDQEVISAYDARTGRERWRYVQENRFTESISGVGPRATPTYVDDRLFATGPSGSVHCLDANTGEPVWTRNLVDDTGASIPMWGFASSPLVVGPNVIVFAGAWDGKALIAYDRETGEPRWQSGNGILSYSTPHFAVLHGIPQVLMMTERGLASYDPDDGQLLWEHASELGGGAARIVQPAIVGNDVLIGTGYGVGTSRVSVELLDEQWTTAERWASRALKPYFNHFVVAGDCLFGFDKNIFTCVDLGSGNRLWKRGRFGHGQVLYVEQDRLLLVVSEYGELVLVQADREELKVLHRFSALEGKTWNQPVIANGKLIVRNDVEVVCYDISEDSSLTGN